MHADDVKRRIRRLKRLERSLRAENAALIWDRFFDLRGGLRGDRAGISCAQPRGKAGKKAAGKAERCANPAGKPEANLGGGSAQGTDSLHAVFADHGGNLRGEPTGARYTLAALVAMSREAYRDAVAEYLAAVYYDLYRGQGRAQGLYDPMALARLDLPGYADEEAVKRRFRELAKRYHPDAGGDAERFMELMEAYRSLTEG